jgi:myo-inositol-1(or 4)-monophosphatase
MNAWSHTLATALEAAREAGDLLRRKLPSRRAVTYKGLRDIVTDADLAAQEVILRRLRAEFPEHAILAEEGQHSIDLAGPTPVWVVDPLDGTTNYSRRFPIYSVSIALAQNGELRAGAIYDPQRREMFFAEHGQGAWVQQGRGQPRALSVSPTADLAEALVSVDWARDPALRVRTLEALNRVAGACRTVRSTGSAALALAYVAMGRLDAYYHLMLQPWDVAAGALLIREAGGTVTMPNGAPWKLGQPAVAATNGPLHAAVLASLHLQEW